MGADHGGASTGVRRAHRQAGTAGNQAGGHADDIGRGESHADRGRQRTTSGDREYFISNDPAKWCTNIPTYAKVQYHDAYPGIDLAYYGNQGKLEYDFIVAPGADLGQIRLVFEGASALPLADSGDLLLATDLGDMRVQKPLVYQLAPDGHKTLVNGNYINERQSAQVRSESNPQSPVISPQSSALGTSPHRHSARGL